MTHRRCCRDGWLKSVKRGTNRSKLRVRAKAVHPFLALKAIFGFREVRYLGLAKNTQRLNVVWVKVNLFMLRRPLLRLT
jgi:IS5 family transposase